MTHIYDNRFQLELKNIRKNSAEMARFSHEYDFKFWFDTINDRNLLRWNTMKIPWKWIYNINHIKFGHFHQF